MRTFDSLQVDYRLCLPYLARVVRIEGREAVSTAGQHAVIVGGRPSVVA